VKKGKRVGVGLRLGMAFVCVVGGRGGCRGLSVGVVNGRRGDVSVVRGPRRVSLAVMMMMSEGDEEGSTAVEMEAEQVVIPEEEGDSQVQTSGEELPAEDVAVVSSVTASEDVQVEVAEIPHTLLNRLAVQEAGESYRLHENDSGSPEFQIARLTAKIKYMSVHVSANKKDHANTRGLLSMVSTRKKLLRYLRSCSMDRYRKVISDLNIRVAQSER